MFKAAVNTQSSHRASLRNIGEDFALEAAELGASRYPLMLSNQGHRDLIGGGAEGNAAGLCLGEIF